MCEPTVAQTKNGKMMEHKSQSTIHFTAYCWALLDINEKLVRNTASQHEFGVEVCQTWHNDKQSK